MKTTHSSAVWIQLEPDEFTGEKSILICSLLACVEMLEAQTHYAG